MFVHSGFCSSILYSPLRISQFFEISRSLCVLIVSRESSRLLALQICCLSMSCSSFDWGVGRFQSAYMRSLLAMRSNVVILPYVFQMCCMMSRGVRVLKRVIGCQIYVWSYNTFRCDMSPLSAFRRFTPEVH